jgi:hypothetical protein
VAVMLAIMGRETLWFVLSIIWLAALVIAIPIVIASM